MNGWRSASAPEKGPKNRHFGLGENRYRRQAGGGADVTKQRKHVVGNELSGVFGAAVGLVAVVHGADFHRASAHAALGIEPVEKELGAQVELDAQLGRRAGEGGRLPQHDAAFALRLCQIEAAQRCRAQAY